MKSLNEQIKEVMQKNVSRATKVKSLVEIGLSRYEVDHIFSVYEQADEVFQYTLGVEIECFNVDKDRFLHLVRRQNIEIKHEAYNHNTCNFYKIVSDSSIEGDNALECVSPVLKGKAGLNSLKTVCDGLNQSGAKVNKTTGLHIHVGLQNICSEQYRNIFINYFYLENAIDKFVAKSRRGDSNSYCKSIVQMKHFTTTIKKQ